MALSKYFDYATRLADFFIPPEIAADREATKLARIFLYSHIFGPFIGSTVPLAIYAVENTADPRAAVLLGSILCFWLFPFLLRYTAAYRTLAFISIQNLIFCILWSCYCYGGVRSPTLAWVLTIPLLAFLYIGPSTRLRLLLAFQFAVSALIFVAVNQFVTPPPVNMAPVAIQALGLVSTIAASLYVAMMALFYANALASQIELKTEIEGHLSTTADLIAATESAKRSSAAKAEFIAKMSHELRTPLNAVIGYSEMLLEEAEIERDAQSAGDLRRIHHAGVHLLKLVNEILDLSRIEAGRMETLREVVDCGDLMRAVASQFEDTARRGGNRIVVEEHSVPGLVLVDATKLRQVLEQLVENALTYTKDGVVNIVAERDGEVVSISVADTGRGISPARAEGFFDRLETVEEADGRHDGGAGVGLLLSKRLCELLGATLSMQSEFGKGARFTIALPAHADALDMIEDARRGLDLQGMAEEMRRSDKGWETSANAKIAVG